MRQFLTAKSIVSLDTMNHFERSADSALGQTSSKVLLERWGAAWKKPQGKARSTLGLAFRTSWGNICYLRGYLWRPLLTTLLTPIRKAALDGENSSFFRLAAEGGSIQLPSSFTSPKITDGTNNYWTFHAIKVRIWLIWQNVLQACAQFCGGVLKPQRTQLYRSVCNQILKGCSWRIIQMHGGSGEHIFSKKKGGNYHT